MAESTPQAINSKDLPTSKPAPHVPDNFVFPENLPTPPFIDVDGLPNFRDLGGYLTASSYFSGAGTSSTTPMMVRRGLLYRCAHPQLLTDKGNQQLTESLGIKHIYDLRSAPEVKKLSASLPQFNTSDAPTNPDSQALAPKGIQRHFIPVYEEEDYSPVALARKLEWYISAPNSNASLPFPYAEGFVNAYRDIATHATRSDKHNAAYPVMLRQIIQNPDEPIIFHCTAGKDRTGIFAAILLRLAGVDDDTIAWEYALTEPGLGSWRDLFIERISRGGLGGPGAKSAEIKEVKPQMSKVEASRIVGARAGNIKAFLKLVLDGEFGGVEKYLTDMCGLTKEEVEKLRTILVVPVTKVEDVVPVRSIKGWTPDGGVQDGVETRENN